MPRLIPDADATSSTGLALVTVDLVTHMKRCGAIFEGEARNELYGNVIVSQDLYGNRWDLLGPQSNNHSA
ncbi:MAG: hypothetical protein ACKO14_09375 [Armatimonadota bacterium]